MKAAILRELEVYKQILDESRAEIMYEIDTTRKRDNCRICSAPHDKDFYQQFIYANTQVSNDGRSYCRFGGCRSCWTRIAEQHRRISALVPDTVKVFSKTWGGIVDARVTTVIPTFADFDPCGPFFGLRAACPDGSMPVVGLYGRTPVTTDCLMVRVEYGHGCSKICPMFGIHGIDLYNGW